MGTYMARTYPELRSRPTARLGGECRGLWFGQRAPFRVSITTHPSSRTSKGEVLLRISQLKRIDLYNLQQTSKHESQVPMPIAFSGLLFRRACVCMYAAGHLPPCAEYDAET